MVRVKRRYILAELKLQKHGAQFPTQDAFSKEFRDKFYQLYGDFGIACLNRNYSIKRYNSKDNSIVISIRKGVHEMALSTLPMVTSIDQEPCNIKIVHLSGTIRKCLEVTKINNLMTLRATIGKQIEREKQKAALTANSSD